MQEKERQKALDRLQVDEKEFATSKRILMKSISPDLIKGTKLMNNDIDDHDYKLGDEV